MELVIFGLKIKKSHPRKCPVPRPLHVPFSKAKSHNPKTPKPQNPKDLQIFDKLKDLRKMDKSAQNQDDSSGKLNPPSKAKERWQWAIREVMKQNRKKREAAWENWNMVKISWLKLRKVPDEVCLFQILLLPSFFIIPYFVE